MLNITKEYFKRYQTIARAILGGVFLGLAHSAPEMWPLAFLFLLPIADASLSWTTKQRVLLWWLLGLVAWLIIFSWLPIALVKGGNSELSAYLLTFLVAGILGIRIAIFGWARNYISTIPRGLADAILWVGLEWLQVQLGLPFGELGLALWRNTFLIQIADVGGLLLCSFFVVFIAANLASFPSAKISTSAQIACALLVTIAYGALYRPTPSQNISVLLASTAENVDNRKPIDLLIKDISIGARQRANLMIWPESALSGVVSDEKELKDFHSRTGIKNSMLLVGGPIQRQTADGPIYFNSAFSFTNKSIERYDKQILVPFGEYIPTPFKMIWNQYERILVNSKFASAFFSAGNKPGIVKGSFKLGVLICWESSFEKLARIQSRMGAQVITILANDSWYSGTQAVHQVVAPGVFRAIENRRTVLRSANHGVTAIILPTGEFSLNTTVIGNHQAEISLANGETFFQQGGFLFGALMFWSSVAFLLYAISWRIISRW